MAAITFVCERVCIASVACITKVWSDKHLILLAAKSAPTSAGLGNIYLTILDVDRLSTFRTVCNTLLRLTVCFHASDAEASC